MTRRRPTCPAGTARCTAEYHRGVFTSQGRNKRANRAAEFANLTAETAAALAESLRTGYTYPIAALHRNWELTLLNQFHDIYPVRLWARVYEVAAAVRRDPRVRCRITDDALHTVAALVKTDCPGVVVFNQLGFARDTVVRVACGAARSPTADTRCPAMPKTAC
ncbi:MAG: hypothetical protein ACLRYE_03045 [Gemmiger formicilis]|uniref:hypothetical protein n=1 Tax=Gemmiger formicilis TaxID=745368 RepID=UPI0039A32FCD